MLPEIWQKRIPVLLAGGAGKLAYFVACLALDPRGTGRTALLAFGALDVAFSAFFFYGVGLERAGTRAGVSRGILVGAAGPEPATKG